MSGLAQHIAFNTEHLSRQTMGDRDLQREILLLFVRQSQKFVELLGNATLNERRNLAHTLKGSARAVGAFAVADASELVESTPTGDEGAHALATLAEAVSEARRTVSLTGDVIEPAL